MKIIREIEYYNGLKLDLYIPEKENFSTVIELHGGGINSGNKYDVGPICEELCKHGYGAVSVNYSLYPNTKFPQYIKDIEYIERELTEYLFDYTGCPEPDPHGKMFFGQSPKHK